MLEYLTLHKGFELVWIGDPRYIVDPDNAPNALLVRAAVEIGGKMYIPLPQHEVDYPPAIFSPKGEFCGAYWGEEGFLSYQWGENGCEGFCDLLKAVQSQEAPSADGDHLEALTDEGVSAWACTRKDGVWVRDVRLEDTWIDEYR